MAEKKMNIHDSDIKLIFGVDCVIKPMDISYGAKSKIGIIQKRCKNVSRLTSKWIRTLLTEALNDKKKDDNKEIARLVCMHVCQKLFFLDKQRDNRMGLLCTYGPIGNHARI
ncbi:hypothetical protein CsSME_00010790 [Camellia sinensis var. sinensis]